VKRLVGRLAHVELVREVIVHDVTGSTNDDARALAARGAPEGTVVLADSQTSGRGRLGRTWVSPDRAGLYLSVLLRPSEPPALVGRYAIAAAVAVCASCRELTDDRVILKWPNDALAEGRKLAGILSELRQGPQGAELILGFGVNVHQAAEDFPQELRETATSLRRLGGFPLDRESVAVALLTSLTVEIARIRSERWPEVAERFMRYAPDAMGRRVRLAAGGEGITSGLDGSGALRIATERGIVLTHAGESVTLVEE
jgi:BirA family biotin operon repressor/biotin-[acetyl-CoA-carboxylase] ligase